MKDQETVDAILKSVFAKTQEEVTALLGQQIILAGPENRQVGKKAFFVKSAEKQVLWKLQVEGARQGEAYLFIHLKDAIMLGGSLLMLPPTELEERMGKGEFGDEDVDSYGEIVNIFTGVVNAVFAEQYTEKLRFARGSHAVVQPSQVDMESAEPVPALQYYRSSSAMQLGELKLGSLQILLPFQLLGWEEGDAAAEDISAEPAAEAPDVETRKAEQAEPAAEPVPPEPDPGPDNEDWRNSVAVLVIAEEQNEAGLVTEALAAHGLQAVLQGYGDDVKEGIPAEGIRGVFLFMSAVSDQGLGLLIKVKSVCGKGVPVIVAGPDWTRKAVLQAVKYGASDILVTPAAPDDIREKIETHLGMSPEKAA